MVLHPCKDYAAGKQKAANKKRQHDREIIISHYPDQLTNPQKKKRRTFAQFGYGLSQFQVPLFPVTKFIIPGKFGYQSYGQPKRSIEKNGTLYTCRGGFIDVTHLRAGVDWTVFMIFKILADSTNIELPWEGKMKIHFNNLNDLTEEDVATMGQKIAFERLTWHEIASWHYHKPYKFFTEQHSTFTPEDTYSNLLGTEIGKRVALRMLRDTNASYSEVATEEIDKMIASLIPLTTIKGSKKAYDIVDLNKQRKLPAQKQNHDVWYDSRIVFHDLRYVFKRDINIGPEMAPWLIPHAEQVGCTTDQKAEVLRVPQNTRAGKSFYNYYTFTITPDPDMFYDKKKHRQLHPPIGTFTTNNMEQIVAHIAPQMRAILGDGFDRRDNADPTIYYTKVKKVFLK